MKLEEGKLILNAMELNNVKRANFNASPSVAALFLRTYSKPAEDVEDSDAFDYLAAIQAYRRGDYEVR